MPFLEPFFEGIGEFIGSVIIEGLIEAIPMKIRELVTGKKPRINGYSTAYKKFIKFDVANKILLTWETDVDRLKHSVKDGLELSLEKLTVDEFIFSTLGTKTIIQPPKSISFYGFHFLVQSLSNNGKKAVGVVERIRSGYTVYNDPNSINLIGETDNGKTFFITLMEDYSKRHYLRISSDIETIEAFTVDNVKQELEIEKNN